MRPAMDVLLLCKDGLRTLTVLSAALLATSARAEVAVSAQPTQNMSCSNGVCAPTAKSAILNLGDLETLLASGNVTVTTTGAGVQAGDIHVSSALAWSSLNVLSLEAHRSIAINAAVSITGQSGLTLDTGKKGALSFGKKGNVTFANLASQLAINGSAYRLVGDITTLASDIASNPGGDFALAASYDAGPDGTYTSCPIPTEFTGTLAGLGNTISNLSIEGATNINGGLFAGLLAELGANGVLENIGLVDANISAGPSKFVVVGPLTGTSLGTIDSAFATGMVIVGKNVGGGLVGDSEGVILHSHASDEVTGTNGEMGGLVGTNGGTVKDSYATGKLKGGKWVGGLVGANGGTISNSYAIGTITAGRAIMGGGLVGYQQEGAITNSYATGNVTGGRNSYVGGLVGQNASTISFSYSLGAATGGTGSSIGGLIGFDRSQPGSLDATYWDPDTSGITDPSQGAGNVANDPGITGLTTVEFQSGLPAGFDPAVWAEKSKINGGLPYLRSNPPPGHR
jgi:hypothetical protein